MADTFTGSVILKRWNEARALERRQHTRQRVAMRDAGFAGAAVNRLTASLSQWSGSVNADLDGALSVLRARARSLCANSEYGRRFLTLVATNVIGAAGPQLQVRAMLGNGTGLDQAANDAIETHFARWCTQCDIGGRMPFAHMQRVGIKSAARDGEALIRLVRGADLPYGLALQLLEADRLAETYNGVAANGNRVRQGVELDNRGRAVAYYLHTAHPGENAIMGPAGALLERVEARDLLHVYLPERAEQVRGYTWLHAVLMRANMLHGYEEAAVVAARVGASKLGIWQRREDSAQAAELLADGKDTDGALLMNAEPGEMIEAPAGYEFTSWNPDYPHQNFESFVKQCLRGYAMGADVATHNLSGDMTGVNYSSARIAELSERDTWGILQEWWIASVCMPVFREWLATALLRGEVTFAQSGKALPAERFEKFAQVARFQGRRWEWTDPKNEIEAAAKRIELGLDSRTRIAASQGRDFVDIVAELAAERELMAANGLPTTGAEPAPAPGMDPAPTEEATAP